MLHWSPTLIDNPSDTEDCDSRGKFKSLECTVSSGQLDSGWMDVKRRQALYIPSLQSDQEIFDYTLEDIAMPSVSFSEEQEFEKTVQHKDHNSNILFESAETVNMDTGALESNGIVISDPICIQEESRVKAKQQKCENLNRRERLDAIHLELSEPETSFIASCDYTQAFGSISFSAVGSSSESDDPNGHFLGGCGDLCHPSADHFSNKENVDVVDNLSESEFLYDMQNLRDSLPKLKVMTPASLHNEISGAFISYSEMEESGESAWLGPTNHDSPRESVGTTVGESEHDTSFCSVDSTMTVSSVESLPKVFYDPDLHRGHHLTAVSVPPLRHGLSLADRDRTAASSKASYNCDKAQLIESRNKTRFYLRNSMGGFVATSRSRTPDVSPSCTTSFSTSSKSRFARRPEATLSKAMVKLVFPSPSKSSSSLNGFAVGNQRTDDLMEQYSQTYGKRVRNLRAPSTAEDFLYSKRRCQRSTTPQIGDVKTAPHSETKHVKDDAKTGELCGRMNSTFSASVPCKQTSSVPRDHRLGISGTTSLRSRMTIQSSESNSGHSFAVGSSHRRSLFALTSCDNSRDICQTVALSGHHHGMVSAGTGDVESGCRAKKRPLLSPGKVVNKRALTLTPPLAKRNPLLQKFFDNIPTVTAANIRQFSDDQMEAVTLRNTLLNREPTDRPSKTDVTTQQMASTRPPSRLTWRADLVTMVTEGSKVPTTASARKSILNVRSYVDCLQT